MEPAPDDPQARSDQRIILWVAIGFGALLGLLGGVGLVLYDDRRPMQGVYGGLGLFVLGFACMYFRFGRSVADLLALMRDRGR
jgi:hypothetical protein